MPASRVFCTGKLAAGPHEVAVRTANGAGATTIRFRWRIVPMRAPVACRSSWTGCWYPPHLDSKHQPMRWDWQIGRVTLCAAVYSPPYGFAAVKFDVDLDGKTFYACPA